MLAAVVSRPKATAANMQRYAFFHNQQKKHCSPYHPAALIPCLDVSSKPAHRLHFGCSTVCSRTTKQQVTKHQRKRGRSFVGQCFNNTTKPQKEYLANIVKVQYIKVLPPPIAYLDNSCLQTKKKSYLCTRNTTVNLLKTTTLSGVRHFFYHPVTLGSKCGSYSAEIIMMHQLKQETIE